MSNLILVTALCIVSWRLVKMAQMNRQQQQLLQQQAQWIAGVLEPNRYAALGQSIAALTIQLQVASKLWQVNPGQAQQSLQSAYTLSLELMQDIRHVVKTLHQ